MEEAGTEDWQVEVEERWIIWLICQERLMWRRLEQLRENRGPAQLFNGVQWSSMEWTVQRTVQWTGLMISELPATDDLELPATKNLSCQSSSQRNVARPARSFHRLSFHRLFFHRLSFLGRRGGELR